MPHPKLDLRPQLPKDASLFEGDRQPLRRKRKRKSQEPEQAALVRCGDVSQSGRLLEHLAGVRRYARALTRNDTDAEDLAQECLLRVIAHSHGLSTARNLRAYLFTTLHNVVIDHRRRLRGRTDDLAIDDVAGELVVPPRQTQGLEVRDLDRALRELPDEQRRVLLMIGLEGMSYAEAAKALGWPIGTVMSRLSRAREALRALMIQRVSGRLRTSLEPAV